jgi:hypothetical protein
MDMNKTRVFHKKCGTLLQLVRVTQVEFFCQWIGRLGKYAEGSYDNQGTIERSDADPDHWWCPTCECEVHDIRIYGEKDYTMKPKEEAPGQQDKGGSSAGA